MYMCLLYASPLLGIRNATINRTGDSGRLGNCSQTNQDSTEMGALMGEHQGCCRGLRRLMDEGGKKASCRR